jgi:hypothetical protein
MKFDPTHPAQQYSEAMWEMVEIAEKLVKTAIQWMKTSVTS